MKLIRTILLIAVALAITRICSKAADASATARFIDSITVAPVAVLKGSEFTGNHTLGAGIDIGLPVNDFVSIHVANYGYETSDWRTGVVDETEVYGKASFAPLGSVKFSIYGKGGATRDWASESWAMGVGLGAQYNFNQNVSIGSDYTINASFGNQPKYSVIRGVLQFSF